MTQYNFPNDTLDHDNVKVKVNKLKTKMEEWLPIWSKLPREMRIKLLKSGKSKLVLLAYQMWKWLDDNFDFGSLKNDI